MKKLWFLTLSVVVAAGCGAPMPEESAEIPALSDAWEEAFNTGDVDSLVALYMEGVRILPPNAPMEEGQDAVREAFGAMIDDGLAAELETVEAVAAGDLAYHLGTYAITAEGAMVDRGKFLEIWRRVDGEWRIASDIWNSDQRAALSGRLLTFTHEVEDPAHWLAAWEGPDGRRTSFQAHGAWEVRVFQGSEDPRQVALLVEVGDEEALMAWLQSGEADRAKAEDGVIEETLRVLAEVE